MELKTIPFWKEKVEEKIEEKYKHEITEKNKEYTRERLERIINAWHNELIKEIENCTVLGKWRWWTIVSFQQKDPQNSILSLRKSLDLGTGFGNEAGAKIKPEWIKHDKYDKIFQQFLSINHEKGKDNKKIYAILWGYRFARISDLISTKTNKWEENWKNNNQTNSPMGDYFKFNEQWLKENKDKIIELGTAYTNPNIWRKRFFAMYDNVQALGYIANKFQNKYYMGKMTIPTNYNRNAANLMIYYLEKFYNSDEPNFTPKKDYKYNISREDKESFDKIFEENEIKGKRNRKNDEKKLHEIIKRKWKQIGDPGMFGIYLNMSDNLEYYWTISNPDGTLESAITINPQTVNEKTKKEIIEKTKDRSAFVSPNWEDLSFWEYLENTQK